GFASDYPGENGSDNAQRRNRREAQAISVAFGDELLPEAHGGRPRGNAIPVGPRRKQISGFFWRNPDRVGGPLQSKDHQQDQRPGQPPAAHFDALPERTYRGASGKNLADYAGRPAEKFFHKQRDGGERGG